MQQHGVQNDEERDLVDQFGCGAIYFALEECMGENDRVWSACQAQVKALRECYENAAVSETQKDGRWTEERWSERHVIEGTWKLKGRIKIQSTWLPDGTKDVLSD